jgi:hypothetical protein
VRLARHVCSVLAVLLGQPLGRPGDVIFPPLGDRGVHVCGRRDAEGRGNVDPGLCEAHEGFQTRACVPGIAARLEVQSPGVWWGKGVGWRGEDGHCYVRLRPAVDNERAGMQEDCVVLRRSSILWHKPQGEVTSRGEGGLPRLGLRWPWL